jgi:hypothetical protein
MRNLPMSSMLISVFAFGTILTCGYEEPARAFTLIELQLLPAVQLVAGQSAAIKVTNVSANSVVIAIITVTNDKGTVLTTEHPSIAPGTTFTLPVRASVDLPLGFHASIELGTAHAAIADVITFDKVTGEALAMLPAVMFDTQ